MTKSNLSNYNWKDRIPHYIGIDSLTQQQQHRLMHSKYFCMLPWIHLHGWPDGRAFPCCLARASFPVGDLKQQTLQQVWNDKPMRDMRLNMLNDLPCNECGDCYEQEAAGFASMRNNSNKGFGHHIHLVDHTEETGALADMTFRYWDVRFSNICNLKCRSCGSIFSSRWYDDDIKIWKKPLRPRVQYAGKHSTDIWEQMQPHLTHIEQIYFAGGEPLIMEEHNKILKALIASENTNTRLIYNTNLTELRYKGESVLDLWCHFPKVCVAASLDEYGSRAEIVRSGTVWAQVEQNIRDLKQACPHIDFMLSPTLSVMNVWRFTEYHRYMVESGFIQAKDFNVNILQGPAEYRIDILPSQTKQLIRATFESHIRWLQDKDPINRATGGFEAAINFMMTTDNSHLIPEFWKTTHEVDQARNECLIDVIPELDALLNDLS